MRLLLPQLGQFCGSSSEGVESGFAFRRLFSDIDIGSEPNLSGTRVGKDTVPTETVDICHLKMLPWAWKILSIWSKRN
jgi:hypothetical protein